MIYFPFNDVIDFKGVFLHLNKYEKTKEFKFVTVTLLLVNEGFMLFFLSTC